MNANPVFGLVLGMAVANSKGLTGSDAAGVGLLAAIVPFPMGVVLASVLADRDSTPAVRAVRAVSPDTGTVPAPKSTHVHHPKPSTNPVAVLGSEFKQLQSAAAELALHESQATIDTELARLVEEIRQAREELDELNKAALKIDHTAQEDTAESAATEKREEAAKKSSTRSTTANRGS
jgi:hypothetical protein